MHCAHWNTIYCMYNITHTLLFTSPHCTTALQWVCSSRDGTGFSKIATTINWDRPPQASEMIMIWEKAKASEMMKIKDNIWFRAGWLGLIRKKENFPRSWWHLEIAGDASLCNIVQDNCDEEDAFYLQRSSFRGHTKPPKIAQHTFWDFTTV